MSRLFRMIIAVFVIIPGLFIFPLQAITPQRSSLKSLAMMPRIDLSVGFGIDRRRGLIPKFEERDLPAEIAKLQKRVKERPDDVEAWRDLEDCYSEINLRDEAHVARQTVVELLRQQLRSRADDGALLAELATALAAQEKFDEAEALFRKAISVDAHNWKAWAEWGSFQADQSFRALSGPKEDVAVLLTKAASGNIAKPTAEKLDQARKLMEEADQAYDKAIELAPKDPAVYRHHAGYAGLRVALATLFQIWKGELEDNLQSISIISVKESLPDYRQIAELNPKDQHLQIGLAFMDAFVAVFEKTKREINWETLPGSAKAVVEKSIATLEKIAHEGTAAVAAEALETMAVIQTSLMSDGSALLTARRSIKLDPSRAQAWNVLIGGLAAKGKAQELIDATESRLKAKDNPLNHVLAAKAYDRAGNTERAKEHVQKALKLRSDNIDANIAATALALRAGDLTLAGNYLNKAFYTRGDGASDETTRLRWFAMTFNRGILLGLSGDEAEARKVFQTLLQMDKNFEPAKQALSLLRSEISQRN